MQGYFKRLGMMHVDIQTRRRTLKLSVRDCSQMNASHGGALEA
jgi:beta-glucosidase/6-phospho-beta-glucosidase/beta-galactosidase